MKNNWFICIQIQLVSQKLNMSLVPLKYLENLNSHLNFEFEGKIKFITVTYLRLALMPNPLDAAL